LRCEVSEHAEPNSDRRQIASATAVVSGDPHCGPGAGSDSPRVEWITGTRFTASAWMQVVPDGIRASRSV
jgi:hypothetical protein